MSPEQYQQEPYYFLAGGGEMGVLTRAYPWKDTVLGDPSTWPYSLQHTLSVLLNSRFPMFLWWGDDMIQFYNDAYRPSLGNEGKHPRALGQKGRDCWPEIWHIIYPLILQVQTTGNATWSEDQLVPIYRNGKIEDVYWTFSYSSVRNETGHIQGVLVICTETTEKVKALKQVQANAENVRNLIMQSPVAMGLFMGRNMVVDLINDKFLEIWGKDKNVIGKPLLDALPELREQPYFEIMTDVFDTGITYYGNEARVLLNRNGVMHEGYYNFINAVFRNGEGETVGIIVVANDVTDQVYARRHSENILRELEKSERRVRSLLENAPFPMAMYIGEEFRIELANQAIMSVWGKGDEVLGQSYLELLPQFYPRAYQDVTARLQQVFRTGESFHARNYRFDAGADGRTYFFNYSFTPLTDASGEVYGVLSTGADVTDLNLAKMKIEQSESNFRSLILQSPVAMCLLTGPEHIVEVANARIIEIWGKTAAEVMNKPIWEALPEVREQGGLEEIMDSVYKTGKTYEGSEFPVALMRHGKMETLYVNFVYEAYHEPSGEITGVIATAYDVSAQVHARQQIEQIVTERTAELKQSNAELAQFAYIASHDLQEPVRKVITYGQLLKDHIGPADEKSNTYLERINRSAGRMHSLIRDILSYSELSTQNRQKEPVALQEVVAEIISDMELLIEQKQASVTVGELPVVTAIPLQMSQLFGNLLSNALKFSKPGEPPRVELQYAVKDGFYEITVRDHGIGFDPEYADKLFQIFQRLHTRNEYEGTGIGLALCKKIVENHGGHISAANAPGGGSVFTIHLPVTHTDL